MRPGRAADHSHPSSAAVMEEYSYTSTHPLGQTGPATRSLYLLPFYIERDYRKRQGDSLSNFTRIVWNVFWDRQFRRSARKLDSNITSDTKYK